MAGKFATLWIRRRSMFYFFALYVCTISNTLCAQQENEAKSAAQIKQEQAKVANQYALLEEKLFSLFQYERENNPQRANLLEKAYSLSKEKTTTRDLNRIVELLGKSKYKDAEKDQEQVIQELEGLLRLLESEDRNKRVRDDIRRNQEYLKEVERLLRVQKSIRAQAESNSDVRRLAKAEARGADRAKRLAKEIANGGTQKNAKQKNQQRSNSGNSKPESPESQSESRQAKGDSGNSKEPDLRKPDERNGRKPKKGSNDQGNGKDASGKTRKPDKKAGKSGPGKGDAQQDPSGSGSPPSSGAPDRPEESPQQSVQRRVRAAEQRMRRAQKQLEEAKRSKSIQEMRRAEVELAKAQKLLEEILRQLREEEVERMLARLETRFRKMLEKQTRVNASTLKLDEIQPVDRGTDFEIRSGKLGGSQTGIALDAAKSLMLLREDGSSVAFPKIVSQMEQDMRQISGRLVAAKTGAITQSVQSDVVSTLQFLIDSLVLTQKDLERLRRQGKKRRGKRGRPGEQSLVDSLAELKMLRGLQQRIYKRHERYAQLLENPDDPIGATENPDLKNAIDRLGVQQQELAEITEEIVSGLKNSN